MPFIPSIFFSFFLVSQHNEKKRTIKKTKKVFYFIVRVDNSLHFEDYMIYIYIIREKNYGNSALSKLKQQMLRISFEQIFF